MIASTLATSLKNELPNGGCSFGSGAATRGSLHWKSFTGFRRGGSLDPFRYDRQNVNVGGVKVAGEVIRLGLTCWVKCDEVRSRSGGRTREYLGGVGCLNEDGC